MDAQALAKIIDSAPALIATRYFALIGCVVLLWDHLLTFRDEIEYMWKLPLEFSKAVFLFNRYFVEVCLCFSLYILLELRGPLSQEICHYYVLLNTCASAATLTIAHLVVTFHIRSLWEKQRTITCVLFTAFFISYGTAAVCVGLAILDFQAHTLWVSEVNSCIIPDKPMLLIGAWAGMVAFDIFVLVMVLVNAVNRPYRQNSELVQSLQRDGIKFFSILLFLRLVTLMLTIFVSPGEISAIVYFPWAIVSITHSRFLLMVKSVGKETVSDWGDGSTTPVTDPTERGGSGSWSRKSELIELEAVPGPCPWEDDDDDPTSRREYIPSSLILSLSHTPGPDLMTSIRLSSSWLYDNFKPYTED